MSVTNLLGPVIRAYLPRNTGWYRKHFKLPASWSGKSVWLYFEGSFHATTAFLNGADIGFHEAGYTSFWLRLDNTTAHYGDKENILALFVDASFGTGWWYEGEGATSSIVTTMSAAVWRSNECRVALPAVAFD